MAACASGSVTAHSRCVTPSSVTAQASGAARRPCGPPAGTRAGGRARPAASARRQPSPRPGDPGPPCPVPAGPVRRSRRCRRARWAPGCSASPSSARAARRPARHHALMRVHRVRPDRDEPDEPALHPAGPALLVHVQRGRAVDRERALRQPAAQPRRRAISPGRPASAVTGSPAGGSPGGRGQDEPDNVVRRGGEQPLQVPGPITSYGGDVTFASPPTRDRS